MNNTFVAVFIILLVLVIDNYSYFKLFPVNNHEL